MDGISFVVVFILTWWMVLFMVLPWGLQRDADGTPKNPKLKKKLIITTLIAIIITAVIYILIDADLVSFREIAKTMAEQDTTGTGT